MKNQHTPGTWFHGKIISLPPDKTGVSRKARSIGNGAEHIGYVSITPANREHAKANARLIAAAPELLSELERITEKFCTSDTELTLEDFDTCKAIIAKAK
jgi:hypothetical protein